jgi:hypothetical protein
MTNYFSTERAYLYGNAPLLAKTDKPSILPPGLRLKLRLFSGAMAMSYQIAEPRIETGSHETCRSGERYNCESSAAIPSVAASPISETFPVKLVNVPMVPNTMATKMAISITCAPGKSQRILQKVLNYSILKFQPKRI